MSIECHGLFEVWSPDEVAECLEGIPADLYKKLWSIVSEYDSLPRSEVPDDFGSRCLAKWWGKFTAEEQTNLNAAACAEEARYV